MRIVFFGTSDFAVPTLRLLVAAGHGVEPVVTQPARPRGRGRKLLPGPVAAAAGELGLTLLAPPDPNAPEALAGLTAARPDLGVLVAYGRILSAALLAVPRSGFVNLHPSLLPEYRGAAPIARALMDGRARTGVTVIAMNEAVDAGDILAQAPTDIGPDETAGELAVRLAREGAALLAETVGRMARGELPRTSQDPARATFARKLSQRDRDIAWDQTAAVVHNRVRAFSPEPGAVASFRKRRLLVLRTRPADGSGRPGEVLTARSGLVVATGGGAVELLEVRPEGGRTQSGAAFRNGQRITPGETLERTA